MDHLALSARPVACEKRLKLGRAPYLAAVACAVALAAVPVRAAQPEAGAASAAGEAQSETHGGGAIDMLARLVNFAILAGTLGYLLRSPIATYLSERDGQIRADLVQAAEMKRDAAAQIEDIDRRMRALPAELEALRVQGVQEIADEEQRIRAAAATDRDRLLEQARRDIDLQVKIAERELVNHAATLAVAVATERIKKNITDDDQARLLDQYVNQLQR